MSSSTVQVEFYFKKCQYTSESQIVFAASIPRGLSMHLESLDRY